MDSFKLASASSRQEAIGFYQTMVTSYNASTESKFASAELRA